MSDFRRNLQEATQQPEDQAVFVSQVAAEKLVARADIAHADDATKTDDSEDNFDDDTEVENVGERATEPKTGEGKKGRREKGKKKKASVKSEYFSETGSTHALIRRASPFWNSSDLAVDISDPACHEARLKGALAAVQAYNMNGLRAKGPSVFVGDFMQVNMQQAASSADKVKTIYMHAAT